MKRLALLFFLIAATAPSLLAQNGYKMAGPYEVIARDGEYRSTKGGSERDMKAALDLARSGMTDNHGSQDNNNIPDDTRAALGIINAYAKVLRRVDGHDAPLCLIQGYDLVQAMTLLKEYKTEEWDRMVRQVFIPVMDTFEAHSPYANGNWGAIVNRMRMACAIYLGDSALYKASIDYFMHAGDNGALPNYIGESGQCQETGRDQAHAQLGLEALAQTCEMAWLQGDDLWGALDNRMLKGFEYTAKYNLGYDVPFETWQDCTGLYCDWEKPGEMSRGKFWDIYQLPYDHFHGRKGLDMPYTERVLKVLADKRLKAKYEGLSSNFRKIHSISTYTAPEGAPLMRDYDVFIQPRGSKEWTRIDTYKAKANAPIGDNKHKVFDYSYAYFDFEGDVFVKVICKNRKYKTARIRPDFRGVIANVQNDSTVQFVLFQPEDVSVEFDGDITNNLLIFTSKTNTKDRQKSEPDKMLTWQKKGHTYYSFGTGMHTLQDTLRLPSHSTLYLEGGAYIDGTILIDSAEDVSITGRGIIRPERGREGVIIARSRNIKASGFITTQCPVGECDGVQISNVKSLTHYGWGDGLNVFASRNVSYERVFCRNSDDCTTIYATRKGYHGSSSNITMTNSTLWADVAHPIFVGLHGNATEGEQYANHPELGDSCTDITYRNIDILCQSEPQIDYQGCLAINCGDNNLVRRVTFDNIRIESLHQGSLLNLRVCYNSKYCAAPGRGIEDVLFRNVRYNGAPPEYSIITGYDEHRTIKNIRFENLRINGKHIYDRMPGKPAWYKTWDIMRCFVGNHVDNIVFE